MCLNTFLIKVSDIKVKFLMIPLYRSYRSAISFSDDTSAIKAFLFFSVLMASFPCSAVFCFCLWKGALTSYTIPASFPDSLNVMYHLFPFSAAREQEILF